MFYQETHITFGKMLLPLSAYVDVELLELVVSQLKLQYELREETLNAPLRLNAPFSSRLICSHLFTITPVMSPTGPSTPDLVIRVHPTPILGWQCKTYVPTINSDWLHPH